MKQLVTLLLFSFSILFLSCGGSGTGKIGTEAGAKFVKETLEKNTDPNDAFYRISVSGQEDGSNIQLIDAYIADNNLVNEVKYKGINLLNQSMNQDGKKPLMFALPGQNKATPKKLGEFDFTKMIQQVENAKKMIPEGFSFFGIASFDFYSSNEMPFKLALTATKSGEAKEYKFKQVLTKYYELNYEVDGNGKMTLLDE